MLSHTSVHSLYTGMNLVFCCSLFQSGVNLWIIKKFFTNTSKLCFPHPTVWYDAVNHDDVSWNKLLSESKQDDPLKDAAILKASSVLPTACTCLSVLCAQNISRVLFSWPSQSKSPWLQKENKSKYVWYLVSFPHI